MKINIKIRNIHKFFKNLKENFNKCESYTDLKDDDISRQIRTLHVCFNETFSVLKDKRDLLETEEEITGNNNFAEVLSRLEDLNTRLSKIENPFFVKQK